MAKQVDYYEFLQISPNADQETIRRVYRFLATRFHPDKPEAGDTDKFHILKNAYDVLSDPRRRAKYDMAREKDDNQITPLSTTIDFMDQMDGELNRRLALLAVLYYRRRNNPWAPEVPLAEVEKRMGFPRDYLDFTTWYLEQKGYIDKADNSDFTLTAEGVDFVESQRSQIPILNKLLSATAGPTSNGIPDEIELPEFEEAINLPDRRMRNERRTNKSDRRKGAPDLRAVPVERRYHTKDRRGAVTNRRTKSAEGKKGSTTEAAD